MSNFNGLDLSGFNSAIANSASRVSALNAEMEESLRAVSEHNARKDAALFETAEASRIQKELLAQQLEEVKEQNKLLKENNSVLKENNAVLKKTNKDLTESNKALQENNAKLTQLYEMAKSESESSAIEAAQNKKFGWVSFAVGTVIGVLGILIAFIV